MGNTDVVNAFAQHSVRLSQAEATHAIEMYMASISMIGRGIAGFERHDGTVHILWSTLYTNTAMINLAGIASLPYEISQAEALASLVDVNHEHRTMVHGFIQQEHLSGSSQFSNKLTELWFENFNEIAAKFCELKPEISMNTFTMPTIILYELIKLEAEKR